MDPTGQLTAEEIVNEWPREKLEKIILEYGQDYRYKRAADVLIAARRSKRITTTDELAEIIKRDLGRGAKKKLHPATQIFQALRIAVNDELGQVEKGLEAAIEMLAPGGVVGVISFHSLEDKIVKEVFRKHSWLSSVEKKSGVKATLELMTKKPLVPTREESRKNPRSRSAKVRFARRNID